MPECNTNTFQIYLNEFSKYNPDEFKIIVLDNGAFHKATSLIIPENIALIFLPPYSPELNPSEKMWAMLKRKFTGKLHRNLSELSDFISEAIKQFTESSIKKTCGFDYVFSNINWTV
jgi:transposase